MKALGFPEGIGSCFATFSNIFRKINVKLLEIEIVKWTESILSVLNGKDNIALDGKTSKGSLKQVCKVSHFLSAVSHGLGGLTLAQNGIDIKTND